MDVNQIEKLNELKEKGLISQEEFEKSKQTILNDNSSATPQPQIIIQNQNNNQNNNKVKRYSKIKTFLCCFFFGEFGGHHFYTGNTFAGVLYLCTLGFLYIGVIFDLIRILFGAYRDGNGNKLV